MAREYKKFGVALSGGGYRAATYHIGTLRALHELGLLKKINVLTSNSGGSILNGYYSNAKGKEWPEIESEFRACLKKNVIKAIVLSVPFLFGALLLLGLFAASAYFFWQHIWLAAVLLFVLPIIIILFFQFYILPTGNLLERAYRNYFFGKATLNSMTDSWDVIMNATNLDTGKLWTFSQKEMGDTSYSHNTDYPNTFTSVNFPISRAVAASSAVPFAFNRVKIGLSYYLNKNNAKHANPRLVDGGIYDNQAIHKLVQNKSRYQCDIVLVSDAGNKMPFEHNQLNVFSVMIRAMDIFMLRIKNEQMISAVFENVTNIENQRQIGYFSLGWNPSETVKRFVKNFRDGLLIPSVIEAHSLDKMVDKTDAEIIEAIKKEIHYNAIESKFPTPEQIRIAQDVGTSLKPLKPEQSEALISHAYVMTMLYVKLFCVALK